MGTLLYLLSKLYGIYTLYLGLPVVMRSPPDKARLRRRRGGLPAILAA